MAEPIGAVIRRLNDLPVFFVGGLPRSGTTWLQQLLNAHPEVLCLGESHFINEVVPGLYNVLRNYSLQRDKGNRPWAPGVVGPQTVHMELVFQAAFAGLAAANLGEKDVGRLVTIGEKNPDNLFNLRRLWRVYEDAKFVHIIRDPRDGAISGYARFRPRLPEAMSRLEYVDAYSRDWVARIKDGREVAQGRSCMELRYEDLHANTVETASDVFRFLGASTDEAMVESAIDAASFERLSGGRKRGETDAQSHYRRGEVGAWRDEMTQEEIAMSERNAGALMSELGYELTTDSGSSAQAGAVS